jgi:hypothetical protein
VQYADGVPGGEGGDRAAVGGVLELIGQCNRLVAVGGQPGYAVHPAQEPDRRQVVHTAVAGQITVGLHYPV